MTNAICTYDFTIPLKRKDETFVIRKEELIKKLDNIAKKWTFQGEKGNTGYIHWQGRLSLKVKLRKHSLVEKWNLKETHFSITSKANSNNTFYVLKDDTRVEGPFTEEKDRPLYIPRQIREISTLYPWQEKIIEMSKVWDTRTINVIIDHKGNIGKSVLVMYMRAHRIGRTLPFCNNFKDLLRMVCDMPESRCYLIDMPRAIDKEKLHSMYSGIESIKNGYAYDDRYHFTEKIFDCPNIFVFTNEVPDMSLVSEDRWNLWMVNESRNLIQYEEPCEIYGEP